MSLRDSFPIAREPDERFTFTLSHGHTQRRMSLAPAVFYAMVAGLPLIATVYLGATFYLFCRDDMIAALMARQAHQQYAYEDRLAAMRTQVDRVTSRQLLDQDSFEGKVHDLISRQAQLETRAAIVAAIADRVSSGPDVTASIPAKPARSASSAPALNAAQPVARNTSAQPASNGFTAFAPLASPIPFPGEKPQPEGFFLRRSSDTPEPMMDDSTSARPQAMLRDPLHDALNDAADPSLPMPSRISRLAISVEGLERAQVGALNTLVAPAARKAARLKSMIADAGLSLEKLTLPGKSDSAMGGPFIPLKLDPSASPFERELSRAQDAVVTLDRARRALPFLPLRKPMPGAPDVTSGFGYRLDPFLGRAALHSGIDFRGDYGSAIRATAGGLVVTAGMNGGYGNMVEIDHGNGLSTRYAHMSAISVTEGMTITTGTIVGRLGSTGRSTGPHLHYEVRVNDDAIDPLRFLKAGRQLAAGE